MDKQELKRRGQIVSEAIVLVSDTKRLSDVGLVLKNLITQDLWRSFIVPTSGEIVTYAAHEWIKFVETPPSHGLGMTKSSIEKLAEAHSHETYQIVRDMNIQAQMLIEERIKEVNPHGVKDEMLYRKNITSKDSVIERGTSRAYRIAVLKRDAPDLAEQVIAKEISAAAGIRELKRRQGEDVPEPPQRKRKSKQDRINVHILDATSAFKTIVNNMPDEVLYELIDLLNEWREWDLE